MQCLFLPEESMDNMRREMNGYIQPCGGRKMKMAILGPHIMVISLLILFML